jgi:hypothetical protein
VAGLLLLLLLTAPPLTMTAAVTAMIKNPTGSAVCLQRLLLLLQVAVARVGVDSRPLPARTQDRAALTLTGSQGLLLLLLLLLSMAACSIQGHSRYLASSCSNSSST